MGLIGTTGWIALAAFGLMLATCVCVYKPECTITSKTKTKCDDYFLSKMHKAHNLFVILTVITITVHVLLAVLR